MYTAVVSGARHGRGRITLLIAVVFVAILVSLGRGLFAMMGDKGQSRKMVNALTVRVALSVLLFILLYVAWYTGQIKPHGVLP
ncbi:MAG: twin transmembrane helix small protein [Gammaproteobacteria bacterium]